MRPLLFILSLILAFATFGELRAEIPIGATAACTFEPYEYRTPVIGEQKARVDLVDGSIDNPDFFPFVYRSLQRNKAETGGFGAFPERLVEAFDEEGNIDGLWIRDEFRRLLSYPYMRLVRMSSETYAVVINRRQLRGVIEADGRDMEGVLNDGEVLVAIEMETAHKFERVFIRVGLPQYGTVWARGFCEEL